MMSRQNIELPKIGHWELIAESGELFWSEEVYHIHGLEISAEIDVDAAINAYHPDDRGKVAEYVRRAIEEKEDFQFNLRLIRTDGTLRHVLATGIVRLDQNGAVRTVFGIFQDITEHKETEKALQESEERLRSVIDNSPTSISLKNTDGEYLLVNRKWHEWFNPDDRDVVGKTAHDLDPIDVADNIMTQTRKVIENGATNSREARVPKVDGTIMTAILQNFPVFDDSGQIIAIGGINSDITELRQVEEAAKDTQARLNKAAEMAELGYFVWDTKMDRCSFCSEEYASFHGVSVDEYLEGASGLDGPFSFTHPEDREERRKLCIAAANGEGFDSQYRIIRRDGEIRWLHEVDSPVFDEEGCVIEEHGIAQDITEQKLAEEKLREAHDELEQKIQERTQELALNEARLNRTASIAKVGHWIWDDIENKAISCSEECARMHGVSVDEYVSLTSSVAGDDNWVHPDDLESWKQCNRHLEETLEPYDTVYRLIPHRGDTRWVREIAEAEVDENGVHVRTHGVMQDITDFKRLEKIKSEFVSSMNHELRTPLTSVVGALGLARSGQLGEVHPDVQSLLDIAYNNCTRLSELINDILDIDKIMSEGMSLVLAPVNVALLIQEAMQANENYGDPLGITFEATDLDDTITVSGDKNRLLQVLSNLMSNAAKFSAKGDTVVISMASEDGNVRVVVTDQGCGIAEEFRDSIFDRFTQADASDIRKVSGSGLGLNISKTIIEQHGGTIDFDSQIGVGSTFFFSLPVLK